MTALEASYAHCVDVARSRARNFYYSFIALPKPKRLAMCALYAFMRECDDLSDGTGASRQALEGWREQLDLALAGKPAGHPVWPAFADTAARYRIPARYLREMIDGVSSDLEPRRIATFEELYRYCYLVASVVGLATIHVFGFEDPRALDLAEKCGVAFQLTNIIRDVREDALLGRCYLPEEDLRRFEVSAEMLESESTSPQLKRLLEHLAGRARAYYEESQPLLDMVHRDSRAALWALCEIYSRLLREIADRDYDVLPAKIRLSAPRKVSILLLAALHR
jgi:phytoene synthase